MKPNNAILPHDVEWLTAEASYLETQACAWSKSVPPRSAAHTASRLLKEAILFRRVALALLERGGP